MLFYFKTQKNKTKEIVTKLIGLIWLKITPNNNINKNNFELVMVNNKITRAHSYMMISQSFVNFHYKDKLVGSLLLFYFLKVVNQTDKQIFNYVFFLNTLDKLGEWTNKAITKKSNNFNYVNSIPILSELHCDMQ